jgi:iron complex transport system substrate-binding protein
LCLAAAAPAAAAPSANADKPDLRVMSTDFCADQLVLALADREDIVALSPDADNDFSYLRGKAGEIPRTRPDPETVKALAPDVVLRFWGGEPARMRKLGVEAVTLDYASDFDGVRENIRVAAAAIGQKARGASLIAGMNARLDALEARGGAHPRALYVTPGGVTAGKATMIDAIFRAAGIVNIAAEKGLSYWPPLPAETLVASPPSFIVTGFFTANSERVNHWSAARHPALREIFRRAQTVHLPADLLSCPGWYSVDAAEKIAAFIGDGDAR